MSCTKCQGTETTVNSVLSCVATSINNIQTHFQILHKLYQNVDTENKWLRKENHDLQETLRLLKDAELKDVANNKSPTSPTTLKRVSYGDPLNTGICMDLTPSPSQTEYITETQRELSPRKLVTSGVSRMYSCITSSPATKSNLENLSPNRKALLLGEIPAKRRNLSLSYKNKLFKSNFGKFKSPNKPKDIYSAINRARNSLSQSKSLDAWLKPVHTNRSDVLFQRHNSSKDLNTNPSFNDWRLGASPAKDNSKQRKEKFGVNDNREGLTRLDQEIIFLDDSEKQTSGVTENESIRGQRQSYERVITTDTEHNETDDMLAALPEDCLQGDQPTPDISFQCLSDTEQSGYNSDASEAGLEDEVYDEPEVLNGEQNLERFDKCCANCDSYVKFYAGKLSDEHIREKIEKCKQKKRHRPIRPETPEGFWNPHLCSFPTDDPRNIVLIDDRFKNADRSS